MLLNYFVTVIGAVSFNPSGKDTSQAPLSLRDGGVKHTGVLSAPLLRSCRGCLHLGDHCRALTTILYFPLHRNSGHGHRHGLLCLQKNQLVSLGLYTHCIFLLTQSLGSIEFTFSKPLGFQGKLLG